MIDTLFQNSLVAKIIINTLFVSIPEQLYAVMFTLILVGEFEYWKEPECKRLINKFDYVRVFLPTVTGALISNIIINTGLNHGLFQFISPIITFIIIVTTNDIFGDASAVKWIVKAFIFFIIGFLSVGITEFACIPFILSCTGFTMTEIRDNLLIYFITSLPVRLLQYTILFYLISRKRTLLKGRFIRHILSNPILTVIFCFLVLFNILFIQMFGSAINNDKVLIYIPHFSQFFIITGVVIFPILNISGFLWGVYLLKNQEARDKKNASEKLYRLLKDMEFYIKNEKYDNIRWKFNEFGMGIEEVAKTLYTASKTDPK